MVLWPNSQIDNAFKLLDEHNLYKFKPVGNITRIPAPNFKFFSISDDAFASNSTNKQFPSKLLLRASSKILEPPLEPLSHVRM